MKLKNELNRLLELFLTSSERTVKQLSSFYPTSTLSVPFAAFRYPSRIVILVFTLLFAVMGIII